MAHVPRFTIATFAVLAGLLALQVLALWRAPAAWYPGAITVRLAPGAAITLGQHELAAPQTDNKHLALRRDPQQGWMVQNLSASRQVVLLRDSDQQHSEQRMGSLPLLAGQRFQVDNALFEVRAAVDDSVAFERDGHAWRYDGAVLYRDGKQQANCPDAHMSARLLSAWNRWLPLALTISRPLSFGGNLYCDNRLGLAQVSPGAAQLARADGRLRLSAGSPDGDRAAVLLREAAQTGSDSSQHQTDLRRQELPLAGVSAMVVGHTRFQLKLPPGADHITLSLSRHVSLFSAPELTLPDGVSWQWQQRQLWRGASGGLAIEAALALCIAALCAQAVCAFAAARRPGVARRLGDASAVLASAALLAAGLAALIAQRAGVPPAAACSLLLAGGALLLWLALPGRLTLLTAAGMLLLAAGLLAQLELGLGAPESSWLRYYQKSAAMLAIGAGLGGLLRLWAVRRAERGMHVRQQTIEWTLALFAAVALAALAAQVLWGDETGVFDLQPVELAKLALTALTAHCLALRFGWHAGEESANDRQAGRQLSRQLSRQSMTDHGARWLQLIAPALLFLALLGLALVQVDDFSPLILLLVWSGCMAFAYALAARNRPLAMLLAAMALAAVAGVAYLRCVGTNDASNWPQAGSFYADRFLVWLNPAEHPHTGQQLLLGARAVSDGGWLGTDHFMGLRSLGQPAGGVVHIPAVQDDFAASFFLNRHGLAGGLLLWMAQAAFLMGIVLTALRAHAAGRLAGDFRHAWSGRFGYFLLCGGGAFVLGHFLLSWGTNLAIFPIMGQPMSFLSAGGSHLLFFLCPLLTFAAISAQSLEEKPSCRSTYNTK